MDIESLFGLRLESCTFSRSTYTFEFCGKVDGVYKTLQVSTPYCFSNLPDSKSDACEDFSHQSWEFLEKELKNILLETAEETAKATFIFCDGSKFFVWADEPQLDNLLIVSERHTSTGEWFVVC